MTDRGYRYQANRMLRAAAKPERCHVCGVPQVRLNEPLMVGHIDGHEENGALDNLLWTCRSCNVQDAIAAVNSGRGRRTHQMNPRRKKSSVTVGQYGLAWEVLHGRSDAMTESEALDVVRSVSPDQKSSLARDIWRLRKARYGESGRRNPCIANPGAGNPAEAARELFKGFHGYESKSTIEVSKDEHYHSWVSLLGELIELEIQPLVAGFKKTFIHGFDGAMLTANPDRTQLYVDAGDQSLTEEMLAAEYGIPRGDGPIHEFEALGWVLSVVYATNKTHLGDDGGDADYVHKLAEETFAPGDWPLLMYDVLNESLSIVGGSYSIDDEGIRN